MPLQDRLARALGERVAVTVTDNRSTMVSFRRRPGLISFRLHHMFKAAADEVVRALAKFAGRGRGRGAAGRVLDDFIKVHNRHIRRDLESIAHTLRPRGEAHDLSAIFDSLNARYFDGKLEARIGWGREPPRRRRRSIKMGTYFHETRVIRIHPALDQERVPEYFVAWVVYHEMLHQAVPPVRSGGRRKVHTTTFWERERSFHDCERAKSWERDNLSLLLRCR